MRLLKVALIAVALILPTSSSAQEVDTPKPTPLSEIDTDGDGKVSAEEAKAFKDADADAGDVAKDVVAIVDASKDLKGKSGTELWLGISGLLAVIFKGLLSLLKVVSKSTGWFDGSRGKAALKYSTLGLGFLAAGGAGIAMAAGVNMAWYDVLIVGLSGPGSMIVHEFMSLAPGVGKHASVPDPDAKA